MSKSYHDDNLEVEGEENIFHDLREERRLAKKKKIKKRIFGVLIVLVFCVSLYATRNLWAEPLVEFFQKSKESIISDGKLEQGKGYPISLSQSGENYISKVGDELVVISDTHISYYDNKGKRTKNLQHFFANSMSKQMNEKLLVYDLNGYNFTVYDKKGELYSEKSEDAILLAEGGNDYVAIVTQTDKYNSYLTIYNKLGEAVFKWSSGQRIVNITFNDNDSGCIVSTMSTSGGTIVSKLYGLEFNTTEEIFETESLGCLIYEVKYCENGDLWVLGDSILYRIKSDGTVIYSYAYPKELSNYALDKKSASLVFNNLADEGATIEIFGESDTPKEFKIDSRVNEIKVSSGETSYLCDDSFAILNNSANIIASSEDVVDYTDFVIIDDNVYFLGYNEIAKMSFNN